MPATAAWGAGTLRNGAEDPSAKEQAVKEAPSSPMAENDFTIKAFGAETAEDKPSDISSTLQRKGSLPRASPSPSPRGEKRSEVHASGVPVHQRLYEQGLATRQKKEEAATKQAPEHTFKPEISPRSRNMSTSGRMSCNGKPTPVYERLSSVGTESQKRLEKLRQERLEAERKNCTFTPKVNSYSGKLLTQKTSNAGNNPQARYESSLSKQQAFMKKMNQTFGGSIMRTSGYGNPTGVNHPGSASIGGSIRSRQLAQRKSLVGCEPTPAMVAAVNQDLTDKMKKQLQAAYGIKPREETPLEEVERWYKAGLKEQAEIDEAAQQAHEAALAESLKEIEGWWMAACMEVDDSTAAAPAAAAAAPAAKPTKAEFKRPAAAEAPAGSSSTPSADQITSDPEPDQISAEIQPEIKSEVADLINMEEEIVSDVTAAAESKVECDQEEPVLTPEAAVELQEEKLNQVKDIIETKEKQLLAELDQLDSALSEVRAVSPVQTQVETDTEDLATEHDNTTASEQQVEDIVFTPSLAAAEAALGVTEQNTQESIQKLPVGTKAAIKYHTTRINAAILLQGSKTRSAIRSHSAKINKALRTGSSSSSTKIKRHTAAMAAAIQKRAAKMAAAMTQHSVRIAALKKDAAAAAAIEQHAAEFSSKVDQISSDLESEVQQSSTAAGSAGSKQRSAAVGAAIKAAAARITAAINEYAALTAATLGKQGSSIVAALQQLAARIAAALRLTAARITKAIKQYRSSIVKAGLKLQRSRAVHVIA